MQTAATGGTSGCLGSGRRAWAHSERTLPGVSAPSSVVRSIIETARSRACSLLAALMLRVASAAERRSSPTWSTPGSPCRNRRSPDSVPVTSASAAAVSAGGAPPEPLRPASCCRGDGTVVVTDVETTRPGRSTGRTRGEQPFGAGSTTREVRRGMDLGRVCRFGGRRRGGAVLAGGAQVDECSRTTPTRTSSRPPRSKSRRNWSALTVANSPSNGPCASTSPVCGSTASTMYPSHCVSFSAAATSVASSDVVFSCTGSPPRCLVERPARPARDNVAGIPPVRVRVNLPIDHAWCRFEDGGRMDRWKRQVNVMLLALLVIAAASGWLGFATGSEHSSKIIIAAHGVSGIALLMLFPAKVRIAKWGLRSAGWSRKVIGFALAALVLSTVASGLLHVLGGWRSYVGL